MTEQSSLAGRRRGESLIDAIDRLIDVGTVVSGDAVIRLAEVDLIHLDLRLLLAAIIGPPVPAAPTEPAEGATGGSGTGPGATASRGGGGGTVRSLPASSREGAQAPAGETRSPQAEHPQARLDQGLGQLVVAVVELVRQLLERQAVRRMRAGTLDEEQLERLGQALQALEQQMVELRDALGVTPSELDRAIGTVEQMLDSSETEQEDGGRRQRRVS